jgi:tetratricopeptide (TPR) repeat protein
MAESCTVAFGRYLRTLRERRKLSLDDVLSLSRAFPEPVGKGYLSRCENGHARVAFSKLIALSRIYEVPAEVLVERMELDMELDRVGGPSTEGLGFAELTERGVAASYRGEVWGAYAFMRDALTRSASDVVLTRYSCREEQQLRAIVNLTIATASHGRNRLALFELEHVKAANGMRGEHLVALLELLSQRHRALGNTHKASEFVDQSVAYADAIGSDLCRAHAYGNKAVFVYHKGELEAAIQLWQLAFSLFSKLNLHGEAARTLVNLAQAYFDQQRLRTAKRALAAAERLGLKHHAHRSRMLTRILLGEIALKEGREETAVGLWREAIRMAKATNDHVSRFKAEFQLYKHAVESGDSNTAASLSRLLTRRSNWIPRNVEELGEFKALSGQSIRDWVSGSQPS